MRLKDGDDLEAKLRVSAAELDETIYTAPSSQINGLYREFIRIIRQSPTIDPVIHGRWIEHHEPFTWMGYTTWTCSKCEYECGYEKEIKFRTPCCPNCGARMDGEKEEEKKNVFELIQEKGREVADVFLKKRF